MQIHVGSSPILCTKNKESVRQSGFFVFCIKSEGLDFGEAEHNRDFHIRERAVKQKFNTYNNFYFNSTSVLLPKNMGFGIILAR